MNARDFVSDLPAIPGDPRANLLYARLLLSYLADHVYRLELANGVEVRTVTNFSYFCQECIEVIRKVGRLAESTEVSVGLEVGTGLKVMPPPQRRWDEFCPTCGHIHIEDAECGFPQGGGRVCRCERQVSA